MGARKRDPPLKAGTPHGSVATALLTVWYVWDVDASRLLNEYGVRENPRPLKRSL